MAVKTMEELGRELAGWITWVDAHPEIGPKCGRCAPVQPERDAREIFGIPVFVDATMPPGTWKRVGARPRPGDS